MYDLRTDDRGGRHPTKLPFVNETIIVCVKDPEKIIVCVKDPESYGSIAPGNFDVKHLEENLRF